MGFDGVGDGSDAAIPSSKQTKPSKSFTTTGEAKVAHKRHFTSAAFFNRWEGKGSAEARTTRGGQQGGSTYLRR